MTTLREMIGNYTLSAHCDAYSPVCNHTGIIDLQKLVEKFGPDFEITEHRKQFLSRLVCSKCGRRNPSITMSPIRTGGSYS